MISQSIPAEFEEGESPLLAFLTGRRTVSPEFVLEERVQAESRRSSFTATPASAGSLEESNTETQ